jgi:hypothetical protein
VNLAFAGFLLEKLCLRGKPKTRQIVRRGVLRAIKAVKDSGLPVAAVRMSPQGQVKIETTPRAAQDSVTDLDRWVAGKGASHARSS